MESTKFEHWTTSFQIENAALLPLAPYDLDAVHYAILLISDKNVHSVHHDV